MTPRPISHIIEPQFTIEGAGVLLRRSIAPRALQAHYLYVIADGTYFSVVYDGQGPKNADFPGTARQGRCSGDWD